MNKVTAVFTGIDGSCGFKKGHHHTFFITHRKGGNILITETTNSDNQCEYENIIAFLKNWNCITLEN